MKALFLVSILGISSACSLAIAAETPVAKTTTDTTPVAGAATTPPASASSTAAGAAAPSRVKYTSGKDVNFEEMLIQGQLRRPEISVVTGSTAQGADGLLRLRENFTDRIQMDAGEDL